MQNIVMSMSVSLSVCPLAYLKNTRPNFTNLHLLTGTMTQLVNPPLITMEYVMYFWFCGWRHVSTKWALLCLALAILTWAPCWSK